MLSKDVKEFIIMFVDPEWNEKTEQLVTVFDHALDIPPDRAVGKLPELINSALTALSVAKPTDFENLIPAINKIEQFGKHIMSFVAPEKLQKRPRDSQGFEKSAWFLSDVLKDGLGLVPYNCSLEANPEKCRTPEKYFCAAYSTRNAESHVAPTMDCHTAMKNVLYILCVYLLIVKKYARKIEQVYHFSLIQQEMDLLSYTKKILFDYKEQRAFYVPLEWISRSGADSKKQTLQVSEIINKPDQRIKLTGQAGSGKTFFLKNLEYRLAEAINTAQNNCVYTIPVYIKLIDLLANDHASLHKLFAERTGLSEEFAKTNIASSNFLLLLDGYDEISDRELKRTLAAQLDQLIRDGAQIIITDRAVAASAIPLSNLLTEYYPQKLSEKEYSALIEKYCNDRPGKAELLEKLKSVPAYFSGFKTPLQIRRLCELCSYNGTIPESPSELTDQYISFLLDREAQEKKNPNTQPLQVFLCALSFEEGAPWLELKVHSVFANWKEKLGYTFADTMECFHLALDLGLLCCVDGVKMRYNFSDEEFSVAFQDLGERLGLLDI